MRHAVRFALLAVCCSSLALAQTNPGRMVSSVLSADRSMGWPTRSRAPHSANPCLATAAIIRRRRAAICASGRGEAILLQGKALVVEVVEAQKRALLALLDEQIAAVEAGLQEVVQQDSEWTASVVLLQSIPDLLFAA